MFISVAKIFSAEAYHLSPTVTGNLRNSSINGINS